MAGKAIKNTSEKNGQKIKPLIAWRLIVTKASVILYLFLAIRISLRAQSKIIRYYNSSMVSFFPESLTIALKTSVKFVA